MKRLKFLLLVPVFLFTVSCEKRVNNNTAESLDGGWEIVKVIKGDGEVDENSMPKGVSLTACKVSNDPCEGVWTSNNGDTKPFLWSIAEKGTIFNITPEATDGLANQATSDLADYKGDYTILELDDVKFIVQKGDTRLEFGK